jgi:hypothetical protein
MQMVNRLKRVLEKGEVALGTPFSRTARLLLRLPARVD